MATCWVCSLDRWSRRTLQKRQDMVVSGESGVLGQAAAPVKGPGGAGKMVGWISRGFGVTGPGSRWGQALAPVEGPG